MGEGLISVPRSVGGGVNLQIPWANIIDVPDFNTVLRIPWDNIVNKPTDFTPFVNIYHAGTTAPADTSILWIDTNTSSGGIKYYNGSAWVEAPEIVAWSKITGKPSNYTSYVDIFKAGTTAPSNTRTLWIDTNSTTGGLKYYNGSSWVHVPVAYS